MLSNDRINLFDSIIPRRKDKTEHVLFWMEEKPVLSNRKQTTGRDNQMKESVWLVICKWTHLWIPAFIQVSLTKSDVYWSFLCKIPVGTSLTCIRHRQIQALVERRKKGCLPPQLSIQRGRKFNMDDLNTFSIISKQEVSPAAVFLAGKGEGGFLTAM